MHFTAGALLTALPALAMGAAHDVIVGAGGALAYSPSELTAAMGDTVNFHFMPGDHSVAQSTFDAPCMSSGSDAIYSGFISPSTGVDSMMFSILINSTDPIWLYCTSIGHCTSGMSMVINAPSGSTLAAYQKASKSAKLSSPAGVSGGIIVPNQNGFVQGGSSSGGSSSSAAASSSKATSAAASSSSVAATSSAAASSSAAAAATTSSAAAASSAASSAAVAASSSSGYAGAAAPTRVPAAAVAAAGGLLAWAMI